MKFGFSKESQYQKLPIDDSMYPPPNQSLYNDWLDDGYSANYPPKYNQANQAKSRSLNHAETKANYATFGETTSDICQNIPVPGVCDRCLQQTPKIRCVDKNKGTLEFICYPCRNNDELLKTLPVQPKKI